MNMGLNTLNKKLTDANLIKEKYMVYFMDLYSGYVAKYEEYRKNYL